MPRELQRLWVAGMLMASRFFTRYLIFPYLPATVLIPEAIPPTLSGGSEIVTNVCLRAYTT
jgi:hypothetical protein